MTERGSRWPEDTLPARIADKIIPEPNSGCWLWEASLRNGGYGQVYWNGRPQPAHRVVYRILIGDFPSELELDHKCYNPACVNPAHLEPVTKQANLARATYRRTHCKYGHPYTPENIRWSQFVATGARRCVQCHRDQERARQARIRRQTNV